MKVFVTYGDAGFEAAKAKIVKEAQKTCEFEEIFAYGRDNLSEELLKSEVISIKRGGGLWSWKPDIILTTMKRLNVGDIIVYCDAGCSLYSSREWNKYWKILREYDIIAQKMYHPTYKWTRKEIIEYFSDNQAYWYRMCQFMATVIIIKISDFTINFIKEWRDIMIHYPELVKDVGIDQIKMQYKGFVQNRHDQAIYSALIYKYIDNPIQGKRIKCEWEHVDYYDPIFKQAIRATRLRNGEKEPFKQKIIGAINRIVKDYFMRPLYYSPLQWYYSKKTK